MMRRMRHGPRRNHHRQAMPHSMACHYSAVLQPSAIHRRTRLPQCFRPQSARVEWTLLDVSPRSTFPISRAMADRMTAQRQNRADFWPATIHTAMSRQRRPPLPASAMPSSSHMLLPHQPANPIPADGITAAGEAEAHPSFHVFHKESQGMGSHAFPSITVNRGNAISSFTVACGMAKALARKSSSSRRRFNDAATASRHRLISQPNCRLNVQAA